MERESANRNMPPLSPCTQFDTELAAYLEGEERPELLAHASQCDFCRCVLADIREIRSQSSELELDEPPAIIWTRVRSALIAEGLIREKRGFWQRITRGRAGILPLPIPLGVLAAALVTAVVLLKPSGSVVRTPSPVVRTVRAVAPESMAPADFTELKQTMRQLEVAFHANESLLEPSMKATYRKSLASLDSEIRECENSIQQEPQNELARQYLSTAYSQKAQLLQSALEFDLR
jgi:hypothetical protein